MSETQEGCPLSHLNSTSILCVCDDWLTGFKRREFEGRRRKYAKAERMHFRNKHGKKERIMNEEKANIDSWMEGWTDR